MDSIGERIKMRRKELNLTQTQIKELTGISSGNLSDIERGKIMPSASALISLSSTLKCTTDWILMGAEKSMVDLTEIEKKYLEMFKYLSADDKDEILAIMRIKIDRLKKANSTFSENSNIA